MEKMITINQETIILMSWDEVQELIFEYLDNEYNVDICPIRKDDEDELKVRILVGKQESPVIPKTVKIIFKEQIQ